jgi:hypothetical protein
MKFAYSACFRVQKTGLAQKRKIKSEFSAFWKIIDLAAKAIILSQLILETSRINQTGYCVFAMIEV